VFFRALRLVHRSPPSSGAVRPDPWSGLSLRSQSWSNTHRPLVCDRPNPTTFFDQCGCVLKGLSKMRTGKATLPRKVPVFFRAKDCRRRHEVFRQTLDQDCERNFQETGK
jgi:hypothetical protein